MSGIIGLAMRMSAVRALSGAATLAGLRVFDSAILPLDKLLSRDPEPFIVVNTEDEEIRPGGRDLHNGAREVELLIEAALAKAVKLTDEDEVAVAIPDTDAGLELSLAVLTRQIETTLFFRGGGVWGDVFRSLVSSIVRASSRRGAMADKGGRVAARQLVYRVNAIAEPQPGVPVAADLPLGKFLAACEGDPETAGLASVIRKAIEGVPVDWPDFYTVAAVAGGYTEQEAASIGIAGLPTGEAPTLAVEINLSDGFTVDEDEADDQLPGEPNE